LLLRLPANRPVGELADQVGVPVVAGVLLDHVDVDPLQGAGFTYPGEAGVAETAGSGRLPARLALGLPCRQAGFLHGAVQGDHLAVFDGGAVPEVRRAGLPLQDRWNQERPTSAMWRTRPCRESLEVAAGRAFRA
jgi:hypothetical protein